MKITIEHEDGTITHESSFIFDEGEPYTILYNCYKIIVAMYSEQNVDEAVLILAEPLRNKHES